LLGTQSTRTGKGFARRSPLQPAPGPAGAISPDSNRRLVRPSAPSAPARPLSSGWVFTQ
jgi:hypothetical protein